jgi:hypothetical protein
VKREKIVSAALTDEEYEKFRDAWLERETMTGERISVSQFLRHTILTSINGNHPPSIPESKQEEVKNVSPAPEDTIPSKLPETWGFNLEQ